MAPHRLTLREAGLHKVPMVGVYTPGWQALPACSWEFVELVTDQGLTGSGEWSIQVNDNTREYLEQFRSDPGRNLCYPDFEEPLYMARWDLIGQVLRKPLHILWAELFEVGFNPPDRVPVAAYTWQRFPDLEGPWRGHFEYMSLPLAGPGEDFPPLRYP